MPEASAHAAVDDADERCADVCAVIVTFNPEVEPLRALVLALQRQAGRVIIVDNASDADVATAVPPALAADVTVLRNAQNLGIAAAQNLGVERALAWPDCRYVLLSDQDSLPADFMVRHLRRALDDGAGAPGAGRIAAVGPWSLDMRSGARAVLVVDPKGWPVRWMPTPRPIRLREPPEVPYDVSFLIASGCLIPCAVLRAVRGMRSSYFIDHVDTESCLRARAAGYRLQIVPDAILHHRLGDATRRVWFFGFRQVAQHSPLRDYYMFRNTLLMLRDVRLTLPWRLHLLYRLVLFAAYYLVTGDRRPARLRFMRLGIRHGLQGRRGRLDPVDGTLAAIAPTALDPAGTAARCAR